MVALFFTIDLIDLTGFTVRSLPLASGLAVPSSFGGINKKEGGAVRPSPPFFRSCKSTSGVLENWLIFT